MCRVVVVVASLLASWEVLSDQQVKKLKTQDRGGSALCAREDQDAPSRYAAMSARMRDAPAAVRCGMTCTADQQCQHFNYVADDSEHPCHLYYYRPSHFDQQSNCLHYHASANCSIEVQAYGWPTASEPNYAFVKLNGVVVWISSWGGTVTNHRGVSVVLVDPFNCSALEESRTFDTHNTDQDDAVQLATYLQSVNDGAVIVAATADEPTHNLDAAEPTLRQLGAEVSDVPYRGAFALVAQKGFPAKTVLRKVLTQQESATTQPHFHVIITGFSANDLSLKVV